MRVHPIALGAAALAAAVLLAATCGREEEHATRGTGVPEASEPAGLVAVERIVLPPPPIEPARAVALLVGIDRYASASEPGKSPLRGCANDVRAVERALVERFGFAPDDVRVLLDEQATHEAIVRAFCEHLIGRSGPGSEALFYFAGHGSRAPDLSGDEGAEGLDSTFLAFDSRADGRAGEYDLSDDELGSLVAALAARGARATVVTDACHSGGGLRSGASARTRSVAPGARGLAPDAIDSGLPFFPREVELSGDPSLLLGADTVHLAACADRELAAEVEVDGVAHGALSWALLQALERATTETTYEELAHEITARLAFTAPGQSVWPEGALERTLFGGSARVLPGHACRASGELLLVQAGWLMGLAPGSRVRVLDGGGERELGMARIERALATSASARWEEPVPEAELPLAMRVVELERGAGHPELALFAADEHALELLKDIRGIDLRASDEEHEYVLRPVDGAAQFETCEGLILWRAEDGASAEESVAGLAYHVERERQWLGLVRLGLDRGSLAVQASFRDPTAAELEELTKVVRRELRPAQVEPVDGELGARARALGGADDESWLLAELDVVNPHPRELFVAVLSLPEDRSRNPIWPTQHARGNRLAPGERKTIPVGVVAGQNWRLERPMRDRYLVVSTLVYADLSVFASRAVLRSAGPGGELPGPLRAALPAERSGSVRVQRDEWGIATVDLLVTGVEQ